MSVIALALDESKPGLLLLWCSFDRKAGSERVTAVREASFLASWLLRHHPYIEAVFLSCRTSISTAVEEAPSHIHLHPLSSTATSHWLRGMNINSTYSALLSQRDLAAFNGLEMLYIHADEMNQDFDAQIDELVERDHTTLNKVDLSLTAKGLAMNGALTRLSLAFEPYLRILSPMMASSRRSVEQILLPDIGDVSLNSVTALCNALASNRRVNYLSVVR
ncbi:hypothetical protein HPB52_008943 [Rhipicephalus sanguineus]|uniref:Uncharacterized protein n=1 Tax=Rhipicephalus sanguineus TaxID=34632 RepID=A0A9D4PF20_RHISA|nr:hypothetical protein HPB52_008943 [Rhipicephalus sanguineus]